MKCANVTIHENYMKKMKIGVTLNMPMYKVFNNIFSIILRWKEPYF